MLSRIDFIQKLILLENVYSVHIHKDKMFLNTHMKTISYLKSIHSYLNTCVWNVKIVFTYRYYYFEGIYNTVGTHVYKINFVYYTYILIKKCVKSLST